jgi:hypothetical protein
MPVLTSLSTSHCSNLLPATDTTAPVLAPVQVYVHCSILSADNDLLFTTWAEEGGSGQPLAFVVGKGCRAPRALELAVLGMSRGSAVMQIMCLYAPDPASVCCNGTAAAAHMYLSRQQAALQLQQHIHIASHSCFAHTSTHSRQQHMPHRAQGLTTRPCLTCNRCLLAAAV